MKKFEDFINESYSRKIELKNKNNPNLKITFDVIGGRIQNLETNNIRFAFSEGQHYNRGVETWCCNNNYQLNGQDMCPDEKIMGIKTKDIPIGHPLRAMYPNKFRKS